MRGKAKRQHRPNQTGRNDKTSRFVMLPHRVLESAAYASLDLTARALLTELISLFDGKNNGALFLGAEDARLRLGLADKRAVLRAFGQLELCGLVELTKRAHFDVKTGEGSRARCWRLAWHAWSECPTRSRRVPQYGWEQFEAAGRRADRRLRALAKYRKAAAQGKFAGVKIKPIEANEGGFAIETGVKFTPDSAEVDENSPFAVGVKTTPHIEVTICCWWTTQAETRLRDEGDHLHVTVPGYHGALPLDGAMSAGLSNPLAMMPPPSAGFTLDAR